MASPPKKNRRKKAPTQEQKETRESTTAVELKVAQDRLGPLPVSSLGSTEQHTPPLHQAGLVDQHKPVGTSSTTSAVRSSQESVSSKSKRKKKKKTNDSSHQTQGPSPKGPTKAVAHPSPHHQADVGASSSSAQSGGGESSFELELEWCIAQLVIGSQRTDASKAQRQENEKLIRVLRSEKTPLPRKRQLMRNLFGDYRSRMKKEPLPDRLKAPSGPSISVVERNVSETRGKFFKKSSLLQQQSTGGKGKSELSLEDEACSSHTNSAAVSEPVPFCFNFNVESDQ